ncbi:MAG: response regulator, partial [Chloroflexota bacterium]
MKASHPSGRILVVDDNKVNRVLLAHNLEQQGHTVESAENGRDALEKLRAGNFDLVLLDIEMPEMNGYQTLEACMNDASLRDVPVIMTSSLDELESVVTCIELGAEDYLTKPLNPTLLKARVGASLEKKRLRDQQRKLFRTFATDQVADQLLREGFSLGGKHAQASVMFADIRSFTTISESRDPAEIIELLNDYFALTFDAIVGHQGTVNQIEGDGVMAVFGAPVFTENHREQAVRAALEMQALLEGFNQQQAALGKPQIWIGIGVASGRMIAG